MSSPISSPRVSPAGSSWEFCPTAAEETLDNPSTSHAICQGTNQQASTIARCNSSENLVEQNPSVKPVFLDWNISSGSLANYVADVYEDGLERGANLGLNPIEAREFIDTMHAIQEPTENKITRNIEEGTSTIEFRPQHGLSGIHGLGLFLKNIGAFAGCNVDVDQEAILNKKELNYSSINLRNHQDLVRQRYKQLWEDRNPENSEKYKIPDSGYPNSTMWPEKKKTVNQLEKQLAYQKRLLQRAINIMNGKQKESDKEIPFDPAFTRIFMLNDKDCRTNKVALSTIAGLTSIFFEYKIKIVRSEQEKACITEINAMPIRTIDQVCDIIEDDLRDHPIEIVDLHQISHLLEKLGGYAASSALIEREYTIDGQERHCTAIILRNRQDLVDERYEQVWGNHGSSHSLSYESPKCNYPIPLLQKQRTSDEVKAQLSSQAQLLHRAVQKMYIDGMPFDPLFERIYVPTDQERINNGASISNLAQTDTILFVYRKSEDRPPKHSVEQICERIKTMAQAEGIETPIVETSLIRAAAEASLPLIRGTGQVVRFFLSGRQNP